MGVLDDITQMRNQGVSDEDIIQRLQGQGISPKAINDALNQAQIKNAVGGAQEYGDSAPYPEQNYGEQQGYSQDPQQQAYPQVQEVDEGGQYSDDGGEYQQDGQGSYGGYQDQYSGYDNSYGGGGMDSTTMVEIAEQVFSEKIQKIQKQVSELSEFKTLTESKVEHLVERVKRVEMMLDKMQMAILERVGSYGRNLDNVKKEMDMMQDSFSKMVPSMADKARHHNVSTKKTSKKHSRKREYSN